MNTRNEKPVFAEERKIAIVDLVTREGALTVQEFCRRFDVSPATIRNDLRDLEKEGKLLRTHGGAMPRLRTGSETTLDSRSVVNVDAKKEIASLAIECVEDGDTLILDVGTTMYEFARLLVSRRGLHIVTNDLKIGSLADEFPELDIHILGGRIRPGYHCTVGGDAIRALEEFAVDKAFLGTNGFDIGYGVSTPDTGQAEVKKAMIAAATKNYVLCDSGKFGTRSFSRFATIEDLDVLITDRISRSDADRLEEIGVEVHAGKII